jgi:hypothetical protein
VFDAISQLIGADQALPHRAQRLAMYQRVLDGTLYDDLPYAFQDERNGAGDYIPLRQRRPSVRYGLCRMVVEDSVALLFSAGHFPSIDCPEPAVVKALGDVIRENQLNALMIDAALAGSVGSVALWMRVLRGKLHFSVIRTLYLTPIWRAEAPDSLEAVTERYRVRGAELIERGYRDIDPTLSYWFQRRWTATDELWFDPLPVDADAAWQFDEARSVRHDLGFVPIVWVRNLPGGDDVDGACTFRPAIETSIEIDYQLSQVGRGLKYASDPTLLIKEPASTDREMIKGAGNALVVSENGDAKLLEIGGTASAAVIDYVRTLREFALESVHGNRANADRLAVAPSGRALELMNQGLIWLADNLRISYGEGGLLKLLRMVLAARQKFDIIVGGTVMPVFDANMPITLRWPRWYPASADDRLKEAQAIATLANAGQISRETAVKTLGQQMAITDVEAELSRIRQEQIDDD